VKAIVRTRRCFVWATSFDGGLGVQRITSGEPNTS
jgi:hypothetical protein